MDRSSAQYVFGPVPSRRLGRSLGVDLIPFKTCTFNCIYCQIGRTTHDALTRAEFVPLEDVIEQLAEALAQGPKPDYITLAGSGEPTLYLRLGELIDRIHQLTDIPVDIITNGSTLWMDEVFGDIVKADLIIPSLDAGDEETYRTINRPNPEITFDKLVNGLERLCRCCPQKVWLEVFLIAGINDSSEQIDKITDLVNRFGCTKIQLNTAVRPPAETFVRSVSQEYLEEIADRFTPRAEIIADFPYQTQPGIFDSHAEAVLEMLRRRPCTVEDIAAGSGAARNEIVKIVSLLLKENKIQPQIRDGREYYIVRDKSDDPSKS